MIRTTCVVAAGNLGAEPAQYSSGQEVYVKDVQTGALEEIGYGTVAPQAISD